MGYYNFPHTRNYDSDLGFLIKRYKELIEEYKTVNENYDTLLKIYNLIQNDIKDITIEQLQQWLDDGTFENIVNENLLKSKMNSDNYIPIDSFQVGYFKGDRNFTTTIYYNVIPKEYMPQSFLANSENIKGVDTVTHHAMIKKSTISINSGIFDIPNETPLGYVIENGIVRQSIPYSEEGFEILYMLQDGTLNSIASNTPIETLTSLKPIWAIQGFYPIIKDYIFVATNRDIYDYQPLTTIGQLENGDYIVTVNSGRDVSNLGMSLRNIYDFVISLGYNIKFLYNLDGGGSSAYVFKGNRINPLTQYENRPVNSFIDFIKNDVIESDIYKNEFVNTESNIEKINKEPYDIETVDTLRVYSNKDVLYKGLDIYDIDKTNSNWIMKRLAKFAYNKDDFSIELSGTNYQSEYGTYLRVYGDNQKNVFNLKTKIFNSEVYLIKKIIDLCYNLVSNNVISDNDLNLINETCIVIGYTSSSGVGTKNMPFNGTIICITFVGEVVKTQLAIGENRIATRQYYSNSWQKWYIYQGV